MGAKRCDKDGLGEGWARAVTKTYFDAREITYLEICHGKFPLGKKPLGKYSAKSYLFDFSFYTPSVRCA